MFSRFSRKSVALLVILFLGHCVAMHSIASAQTLSPPTTAVVLFTGDIDRDGRVTRPDVAFAVAASVSPMMGIRLVPYVNDPLASIMSLLASPISRVAGNTGTGAIRARFEKSLSPTLRQFRLTADLSTMRTVLTSSQQLDGVLIRSDAQLVSPNGTLMAANSAALLDTLGDPNMGQIAIQVVTSSDHINTVCAKQLRDVRGNVVTYVSPAGLKWDGSQALAIDLPRAFLPAATPSSVTTGNGTVTISNIVVTGATSIRIYRRIPGGSYVLVTEIPNGSDVTVQAPNGQPVSIGLAGVLNNNEGPIQEFTATPTAPPMPNFAWQGTIPTFSPATFIEGSDVTVAASLVSSRVTTQTTVSVLCRLDGQQQRFTALVNPGNGTTVTVFHFTNVQPDATDVKAVTLTIDPDHRLTQSAVGPQVITTTVSAPRPNVRIERVVFNPNPVNYARPTTATIFLRSESVGRVRVGHITAREHFCGPGMHGSCEVVLGSVDFDVRPTTSNVTYTATMMITPSVGTVLPDGVTETIPVTFSVQVDDIAEKSTADNAITTSVAVRGNPQQNLKIISASFSPARPRVGESVTVTIAATRTNIAATTATMTRITRIESGATQDLELSVPANSGPLTQTFTIASAEFPMNFSATLDNGNAISQNKNDDTLVFTVPTIPPPGPKDDAKITKRGSNYFFAIENVDRHLGQPRSNDSVIRHSDVPVALAYGPGAGQALTVSSTGTIEFMIDTAIAGDHRIDLRFTSSSGEMFMDPNSFAGSAYLKPTGSTNGNLVLCYRVASTPQGRIATAVAEAFVRTRPYTVASDPNSVETSRPADQTDLFVDPMTNTLEVQSVLDHLVAAPTTLTTTAVGLFLVDPSDSGMYDLSNALTATFDAPRNRYSVPLTALTTTAEHRIQLGFKSGNQRILIGMFSFGSKTNAAGGTVATHSLVDPTANAPIVRLRWNPTTGMWGTARSIVSAGSGGGGGSGS